MHEAAIAQNIIEDIGGRIEAGDITGRVRTIYMSVGRLTTVVPENLCFLFEVLSKGSALEGCSLAIDHVPIRIRCTDCTAQVDIEDIDFHCPLCGCTDVDLVGGRELIIESVEVE